MSLSEDDLKKLLPYVLRIASEPSNLWFKEQLSKELFSKHLEHPQIDEIYEYCIHKVIEDQAKKFYEDFKLSSAKTQLVRDFIRAEKFKRANEFGDFSLAVHQQIEMVVNKLIEYYISDLEEIMKNLDVICYKSKQQNHSLRDLIFFPKKEGESEEKKLNDIDKILRKPLIEWAYNYKIRLILYYFYYDQKIYSSYDFHKNYSMAYNSIYQARNLNHRGGIINDKQKRAIEMAHRNYYKYLGFLEDFLEVVNNRLA